ncbi:paramyosin, putative, partial [Ixodes scapularis]
LKKHAEEIFAKLKKLRAKFAVFVKEVKNITVEKAQKLMKMIVELRDEIKQEISQLLNYTHSYALYQASDDDEDKEAYIIDTLKSISATLKEKFLTLGENIRQKLIELKGASGEQAKAIKEQLTNFKNQLSESLQALKRKVADMFNSAHYTSFGSNALEVFAKLFDLREKLSNFIKGMKTVTGEKLEKLQVLIKELREDIKKKVQELLHGSSETPSALYQESDDVEDDEAYIIDTLKGISVALKERFATLVEKIRQKLLELKGAAGEQAKAIKEQLENFKNQLRESRQALQQEVAAIFEKSRYASFGSNATEVVAKLLEIREKLNSFIEAIRTVTCEKLEEKLKGLIRELRQEIKEKVQELLRGSSEVQNSLYQVSDVDEDNENYIMKKLKDISQSLKARFIVLIDKIKEIVAQLKTTTGEHVQVLQTRLQVLRMQLGEARRELMKKVKEFLTPAQYFDYGGKTNEFAEKLLAFRWKLEYLMNELKTDHGENYGEVKDLIDVSASALYQANLDDDQNDKRAYVINTLKDIAKSLKEKFLNIGEKIRQKLAELKTAAGAQVVRIKEQLKELAEQMFKAREELREKLKELVRPKQTQYAYVNDHGSDIFSKITHIKEKLASFLKRMKDLTGETLAKLRTEVGELREAIQQQISQLLRGSDNTPSFYLAIEDIEDNEAYIID